MSYFVGLSQKYVVPEIIRSSVKVTFLAAEWTFYYYQVVILIPTFTLFDEANNKVKTCRGNQLWFNLKCTIVSVY